MASKIELYREVLEIEPNSKVFFPLARQLSQDGRHDEAVDVLHRGIAFHPDHLEAKFLLIELLSRQGREGEADAVFGDVGALLARYPSVWLLWSKIAAVRSKDPSLALLFLAHYFQNDTLTWSEVVERGLASLSQAASSPASPVVAPRPEVPASPVAAAPKAPVVEAAPSLAAEALVSQDELPHERAAGEAPPLRGAREVMELAGMLDMPAESADKSRPKAAKGREPEVRTRTMAALLAEQGDRAGALDIYKELLASASPGAEREELLERIRELTPGADPSGVGDGAGSPATELEAADAAAPQADKPKGAAKLVNLLEALANRLDARAGG